MTEFQFLHSMFRRLTEAESFAADAKRKRQDQREDAWRTAALSISGSIKDYLTFRGHAGMRENGNG